MFDSIDHNILIKKLEYCGVTVELNFFKSYLTDRFQMVKINNIFSDELPTQNILCLKLQYWAPYCLLFMLMDYLTKILMVKYCVLQMIQLWFLAQIV